MNKNIFDLINKRKKEICIGIIIIGGIGFALFHFKNNTTEKNISVVDNNKTDVTNTKDDNKDKIKEETKKSETISSTSTNDNAEATSQTQQPAKSEFTITMTAQEIQSFATSIHVNYTPNLHLKRDKDMNTDNSKWDDPLQFVKTDSKWTQETIESAIRKEWEAIMKKNYYSEGGSWNVTVVNNINTIEVYWLR